MIYGLGRGFWLAYSLVVAAVCLWTLWSSRSTKG